MHCLAVIFISACVVPVWTQTIEPSTPGGWGWDTCSVKQDTISQTINQLQLTLNDETIKRCSCQLQTTYSLQQIKSGVDLISKNFKQCDEACKVQSSMILQKLDNITHTVFDGFVANEKSITHNMKETNSALFQQQNVEINSNFDRLTPKLEKVENMAGTLQLMQKQAQETTLKMNENMNSLITLQQKQNMETKSQFELLVKKIEKIDLTLEVTKTQVQENAKNIKRPRCQKMLQWGNVTNTNLFSADGKHFYYDLSRITWYKARDWCTERGMQLASLKTLSQMEAVSKELRSRRWASNIFWLSASDIGRTPHGQFQWADGTPVDKSTWASGNSDRAKEGQETCVFLYTGNAKLFYMRCSLNTYTLCEIPAALSTCFS